ncbi:hypothetical protein AB0945_24000 [Streptomyces sp. NPDC005474]|uniref:hypothetical protein n=1 Tax=Streptomyces sp. NPDC005474 TaxID=3154878 RepID=UPI0034546FBC
MNIGEIAERAGVSRSTVSYTPGRTSTIGPVFPPAANHRADGPILTEIRLQDDRVDHLAELESAHRGLDGFTKAAAERGPTAERLDDPGAAPRHHLLAPPISLRAGTGLAGTAG